MKIPHAVEAEALRAVNLDDPKSAQLMAYAQVIATWLVEECAKVAEEHGWKCTCCEAGGSAESRNIAEAIRCHKT